MTTRNYSSRSQQSTLTSAVTAGASTMVVQSGSALMGGQSIPAGTTFTIVIDPDTAIEEIVDATAVSTNTLSITRAIDGSSAQAHSAGAVVRHMAIGRDYREANAHIEASTGVHGISNSSTIVGTIDTQTLTNKTLTSPTITSPTISGTNVDASIVFEGATPDAFETTLTVVDPTQDNTITMPNTTGTVVIATAVQTLTNKTLTSPTISGSPVITGLSSAGMTTSSATPKDYVDSILGSATAAATSAASAATSATSAATSATSAAASATAAAASAVTAGSSATAAATSATSAAASATAAATSATSSAASATTSQAWATQLVTPVSGTDYSAKYNANLAAASATSSATSATASATSATASATSASAAATSASSALTSQTAAATSATSAAASATAAATSATSAAASATAAATSATSAAASATAAAGYVVPSQTGNAGKALVTNGSAVSWSSTINGTAIPATKTLVVTTDKLSALAATTSAELAGVISDETGTGALVFANTPTLVTPALGDATATSIVATVASGTTVPLTIQNNGTGNSFVVNDVASDTTPFVIDADGNVGIAITTPLADLHINSSTTVSDFRMGNSAASTILSLYTSSNDVVFNNQSATGNLILGTNASTERMRITSAGLVGIGATPSGAMLHIVNNTAGNVGTIIKGATSQSANLQEWRTSADSVIGSVDSVGNFGIGHNSPVTYASTFKRVVSAKLSDQALTLGAYYEGGVGQFAFINSSTATAATGSPLVFQRGSSESMRIASGGQLLINTTTSNNPNLEIVNSNGNGVTIATRGSSATDATFIGAQANTYYSTPTYATTTMGQYGGSATGTTAGISNAGLGVICFQNISNALIYSNGSTPIIFGTTNVERMRIDASGNVGIGTSTPAAKLDVNGSIKSDNLSGNNRIINGAFDIWQRGITFTGGQYGADRFNSGAGSNAFTVTQVAGIGGSRYAAKITQTGSNSFTQFGTQIEFNNCYDLQNKTVTISFVAQANNANTGSTAFIARTRTIAGVDGACLFVGTNADTSITLTTTATTYTVTRTLPATFGSLSLEFCTNAGVTGDGYTISNIKLELGAVATPFTRAGGTIDGELAACARYYYSSYTAPQAPSNVALATSTTVAWTNTQFPSIMRAAPTIVLFDYSSNTASINPIGTTTQYATATASSAQISKQGFIRIEQTNAQMTSGSQYWFYYTASAEL
jgi:hypothetical protein